MRPTVTFLLFALLAAPSMAAHTVRIGVLGLFHSQELTISAPVGVALAVHTGNRSLILESSSGTGIAHIRRSGDAAILEVGPQVFIASTFEITARDGRPCAFVLAVPGKIIRRYVGTLEVKVASEALLAIVSMDLETAVASVVAGEATADVPLEAMKAQAVAARSYFVAGTSRHQDFDFCDTTHCQFLREFPAAGHNAARAAAETHGMVLAYESHSFAAMYTRSCNGRTRTPADVGLRAVSYPYYSVDCRFCRENPVRWRSRVSAEDIGSLRNNDEQGRLALSRRLGWNTVPSDTFDITRDGNRVTLRGTGQGHGIGLCQAGATAMAREGASFRAILAHYYPNTTILNIASDSTAGADRWGTTTAAYPGYQTLRGSVTSRR